ncbi:MAG: LysE family translocator [Turneriella sp.]|nr:LysE family translocator [Turneriella sp.]
MPVTGPVALVVFRCGLRSQFGLALRIAVGAAIAEGIYCAVAAFGYAQILSLFPFLAVYLRYIGAIVLMILGVIFLLQRVHLDIQKQPTIERGHGGFVSGFLIAALNPTLFLTWGSATSTIFSWFEKITFWDLALFPVFACFGIVSWFAIMLEIFKKYHAQIGRQLGFYAVRGAALLMVVSGGYLLTQAAG